METESYQRPHNSYHLLLVISLTFAVLNTAYMKKIIMAIAMVVTIASANAQLKTPAPSPTQTLKQDFGLSSIELSYSRPGMKNRKLYVDLAPTGKVWRTGANSATTLTFGDDVTIGGTKIPAGKYGMLTIPAKNNWIVIITKQTDVTSPAAYKQDMDVVRIEVKPAKLASKVETLTMQFTNVKPTTCDLELMWDKTSITLPISTDIDAKVMASIDVEMKKDKPPYYAAAVYYLENGKDLKQSLAWFDKAVEAQPTAFYMHHQRANCLAKLGMKKEAIEAAEKSRTLAKEQQNDDYVRLNDKLLAQLK
jgi:hypothetical protein